MRTGSMELVVESQGFLRLSVLLAAFIFILKWPDLRCLGWVWALCVEEDRRWEGSPLARHSAGMSMVLNSG